MPRDATTGTDTEATPATLAADHQLDELIRRGLTGYGTAEVSDSGIDISMLRQNLRLSPTERVRKMVTWVRYCSKYRGTARPRVS